MSIPQGKFQPVPCPPEKPMYPRGHLNSEHIGVTTSESGMYQMSCMDRMQAQIFNPLWRQYGNPPSHQYEAYNNVENFQYRTNFDKEILREFDPVYNASSHVREEYASCGMNTKGGYQPRHSKLLDDPYQPYSYRTTYPSIS